ncbi:MAG: DMT family transporter [Pseudomonadota bacterium]|nr:DMT family transporter [Pseudomonadota bacterium]
MTIVSAAPARRPLASADLGLYAGTVLVWGTTWLALKFQLGAVDPQVSIVWRFLIAAPLMFLICRIAGARIVFPLKTHLRFAGLGLFLYSTNFILFYNAGHYVVSGLLSVIFSLAAITNIVMAVLFLGDKPRPRVALGALCGLAGVFLMFWRDFAGSDIAGGPTVGLLLGVLGCLSFSTGNMISARVQRDGIPVLSANAWGVSYGVLVNAVVALAAGSAFTVEPTARYLLSLLWLAIPGSVLAFWMYLELLGRIGADRAAYTTVLSPVLALLISTFVEDFRWSGLAIAGLVLVAVGNVLVLRRERS